jgi:hypothetical protein
MIIPILTATRSTRICSAIPLGAQLIHVIVARWSKFDFTTLFRDDTSTDHSISVQEEKP